MCRIYRVPGCTIQHLEGVDNKRNIRRLLVKHLWGAIFNVLFRCAFMCELYLGVVHATADNLVIFE